MSYFIIAAVILYVIVVIIFIKNFHRNFKLRNQSKENVIPWFSQKKAKQIYYLLLAAYVHFFFFIFILQMKTGEEIWNCIIAGIVDCLLATISPPNSILLGTFLLMQFHDKKLREKKEFLSSHDTENT